jgi:hypothetical protein
VTTFPSEITIEEISKTSSEYLSDKIELYSALYEGGDSFRKNKRVMDKMLIRRKMESGTGEGQYERRKERAPYVNRAGGLIDWFVASVFPDDIEIIPGTGANAEYWESLNENADGIGTPFGTLCRQALLEMLVNRRSYFRLSFDSENDPNDARWSLFLAGSVDDWQRDEIGALSMVRAHGCEDVRSSPFKQPDRVRHTWTYYLPDAIAIYEAEAEKHRGFQPTDKARLKGSVQHDFAGLPVFDVRAGRGQWAMDRIFDVVKAVFNREASIAWALDMQAYAQPVLNVQDGRQVSLCGSELHAIRLGIGETFGYAAPPPSIFDPLFKDADRLNTDFHAVIQAMAINAAAIPQAGRLSADAVGEMRQPLRQLLLSFSWPIREAANRAIKALTEYRGEPDGSVTIEGMDRVADVSEEDIPNGETDGTGDGDAGERGQGTGENDRGEADGA